MRTSAIRCLPYVLYGVLTALLLPFFRLEIGPDQISYINIADLYAKGLFSEAVNGFWSPLLSWLMVPLIAAGVHPWPAGKVVTILSGFLAVWSFGRLLKRFDVEHSWAVHMVAAVMTAALSIRTSADLMTAALLMLYFAALWSPEWPESPTSGLLCGLLGGFLYFSKNYMFFFFCLHFTVIVSIHFWRQRSTRGGIVVRQWLAGLVLCALISSVWMMALSRKYGKFTISRAGEVNLGMVGPEGSGYRTHKLLSEPSSPHAWSTLQDPPPDVLPKWKAASAEGIKQIVRLVRSNLKRLDSIFRGQTLLWLVLILGVIVLCEAPPGERSWLFPVLTIALLPAGYLLVIVVDRYLWAIWYLLLILGAVCLRQLRVKLNLDPRLRVLLAIFGAATFFWGALTELRNHRSSGRSEWALAQQLRTVIAPESRVVSCGSYERSLIVSYHLGSRYYGLVRTGSVDHENARELNPNYEQSQTRLLPDEPPDLAARLSRYRIGWMLVWPGCEAIPGPLQQSTLTGRYGEVSLYRLN
ncbi:MAG: hypothetical protein JNL98_03265 [Bryobacterales bacterium]|nr:hypothetical protein [Bryobacterales bacterium]